MRYCKRFDSIALTSDENQKKHYLKRLRCKQWDCEYCVQKNKQFWRYHIYKFIENNPDLQWSFHTFTMRSTINRSKYRANLSAEFIKKNWDILSKRLRRRYGKYSYIRVIERHKSGSLHIHLLASFLIPKEDLRHADNPKKSHITWLKKEIVSLGWGYIINNQNAISGAKGIAVYVTKYMTKLDSSRLEIAKYNKLRIVQTSRDIGHPQHQSQHKWKIRYRIHRDELRYSEFKDLDTGVYLLESDFDEFGYYPEI